MAALTEIDLLSDALEMNKVSEAECLKVISLKMRKSRRIAYFDKAKPKWEPDHRARAEAAETLLDYLGHHRTTRVIGSLNLTCAKEMTDDQLAIIATGSGSGVVGEKESQE